VEGIYISLYALKENREISDGIVYIIIIMQSEGCMVVEITENPRSNMFFPIRVKCPNV
jgi:hypothetical protein